MKVRPGVQHFATTQLLSIWAHLVLKAAQPSQMLPDTHQFGGYPRSAQMLTVYARCSQMLTIRPRCSQMLTIHWWMRAVGSSPLGGA